MKSLFKRIKSFNKQLRRPLNVIGLRRMTFFLWISFTLIGGLIGIIVSIMKHWLFGEFSFLQSLYIESSNGAFYTYSIAMLASVLSSVFINFAEQKVLEFRRYKIGLITFSVFALFFGGIFYALGVDVVADSVRSIPEDSQITVDWKQLVIFLLAISMSVYGFCVCRLDAHTELFGDIRDNTNERDELPDIKNY